MVRRLKQIVRIREKQLLNDVTCLYMDIYYKGKRSYEYPGLYLVKEKNSLDTRKNNEVLLLAENIRSKLQVDVINENYGFTQANRKRINFIDFYTKQAEIKKTELDKAKTSKSNVDIWNSSLKQLIAFSKDKNILLSNIDEKFIIAYQDFLLEKFMPKTASLYYQKFVEVLKAAVKARIIKESPANFVDGIIVKKQPRIYLTIEELRQLGLSKCESEVLKRAFLFSSLTGLRAIDIKNLTFAHLSYNEVLDSYLITFIQQKTSELMYHYISKQAKMLMGVGKPSEKVFKGFNLNVLQRAKLKKWISESNINKKITFHKARHTYATNNLTHGVDLYTVSKLLGHNSISSTQDYASIIDLKKIEAVKKIPEISIVL